MDRTEKITIGACWDGSSYYSPEYINRLYRACLRNTEHPFDFVLYAGLFTYMPAATAALDPRIRIEQNDLPYWWCGMPFWMENPPGIETRTLLYLDLDVVIVGSLDDLIEYPSDHAYMKDYPAARCPAGLENDGNASASLIRNGAGAAIWEGYVAAGKPTWSPLLPPVGRKLPLAVQTILNDPAGPVPHDVFPEAWVASYKLHVLQNGLPEDCRIISFHGHPKPHDVDFPWVKENWK